MSPLKADGATVPLGRPAAFLLVFLTWAALYLPGLGVSEIQGDEGRRILPAITMLQTGDWLVPHLGGQAFYHKPPVINWVVAASFLLTGRQDEWSARLPSVLFVLAFVTLLMWCPGDWPHTEARLIAAIIFLTSFGVIKKGRQIEIEAVYVSLTSMSVLTWLVLWTRHSMPYVLWLVPCAFLSCGMLTKGPPILLFYYGPVVCILAYSRRLRTLVSVPHLLSLVLCLGLPAVWMYLVSRQAVDRQALAAGFSETLVHLAPTDKDGFRWATQVLRSFVNPLPWLFLVPLLWRRDLVGRLPPVHLPLFKGARLGLVIAFLGITLIPGNRGRYSLPVLGLESILLGWLLAEAVPVPDRGRLWRGCLLTGYTLAVPLGMIGLIGIRTDFRAAVLLAVTAFLVMVLIRRRWIFHTPRRLALLAVLLAAGLMLEYALFTPRLLQKKERCRLVAATLNSLLPDHELLYVYRGGYQDFLFYIRPPVEYLLEPAQINESIHYLLIQETARQQLQDEPALGPRLGKILYRFTYRFNGELCLLVLR